MTNFNSDLNNLFENYQKQQKYSEWSKASKKDKNNMTLWGNIDVAGAKNGGVDGKITSADIDELNKQMKNLLKKETLFDLNNDGFVNQADLDIFEKSIDIDGGGVSKEEKNFSSKFINELVNLLKNNKETFNYNNNVYLNGNKIKGNVQINYENNVLSKITSIAYNSGGKISQKYIADLKLNKTKTLIYDEKGKVISDSTKNSHGEEKAIFYTYNGETKSTATQRHYLAGGKLREVISIGYKNNNVISSKSRESYHTKTGKVYKKHFYTVDDAGHVYKEVTKIYSADGKKLQKTHTITGYYNWYGLKYKGIKYNELEKAMENNKNEILQ